MTAAKKTPAKKSAKAAVKSTAKPAQKRKKAVASIKKRGKTANVPLPVDAVVTTPKKTGRPENLVAFPKGVSGNPNGRPKGSRHKLSEAFVHALAETFEKRGQEAIDVVVEERPDVFLGLIAKLVPKEVNLDIGGTAFEKMWAAVNAGTLASSAPPMIEHNDDDDLGKTIN